MVGEMSTLCISYCNRICVPKRPQLRFISPQCNSNAAVSIDNISHPPIQRVSIVSRYDILYKKQNRGQYTSGQTSW